ncbi:DNA polymerase alpha subunit B [Ricinus communis]|uniref:DNA polymerase alpha subunit B n=1 Tax=Ricinus communis TaxID=3988 RepID=B9RMM9_RICCO|nr:DNA polymerase alpha subunit B [Ricinus communis]EEF47552.1 alpha DNA polymerase, putative [Ricinus communis]|eukprot:XP_002514998.1 DNA polymerase alpha subunit B [Ricinus communis]
MEEEIKAEFNKSGFTLDHEEEQILKKCLTFCINYNLKPADLVSSWEVYYLNRQLDESTVQNGEMDGFLLHLQNEQKEAIIKEEPDLHIYSSKDVDMILNDEGEDLKEEVPGTPTDESQKLNSEPFDSIIKSTGNGYSSGKRSKHVTPFGRRTDKFVVKFNINNLPDTENGDNEHVRENMEDDIIKRVQPRKKCSFVVHGSGPEPGCRFMYDRIEDRFNALDNRIRKHAAALVASGLYEEPTDPTVASQRNVFAVGMICCDGEGRLNEKSVLLQSSIEHSGGQRVHLDLHNLSQFSIFPGQIVAIEGHNPSGHCLVASKLVDSIPLSAAPDGNLPPAKKQALDQEIESIGSSCTQEISVLIASGPFTTLDNLMFEPLTELLAYASRKLPQLLILLGPFVDSEHPEIKKGTVDGSFDEIFRQEILRRLQDYVEYMGSDAQVLIVPSTRDANHDFVFPQPAFDIHRSNLQHQIRSLTNPGIFEANQVRVGCCTVDIIKQLGSEEMSRNPTDGTPSNRMSRLANHILSQRSFYPLYPPAEDVPLDFSLAPEALHIPSVPHILIVPSDMKYFIKVLSLGGRIEGEEQTKCVCINPGRLAKGEGGGTFVELNYRGSPDKMNASVIGI